MFWSKFSFRKITTASFSTVLAEIRLPPHARIDRHPVRHAPRILRIRAQVPVVDIQDVGAADLEPRDASRQEIRKGVPGHAAVNGPAAAGAGGRNRVEFPASHVGAETELMAPPDQGHVVGNREELVVRRPLRRSSSVDVEIVGDGQRELVAGRIAVHLHADIGRAENPGGWPRSESVELYVNRIALTTDALTTWV